MRAFRWSMTLWVLGLVLVPNLAHAGGFEVAQPGARALGRGGAFTARADDGMALLYNPANLAMLPGYQLMLNGNLTFMDACVQREGTYGEAGVDDFYSTVFGDPQDYENIAFPEVCRSGYPAPSPSLIFTARLLPELGIGVGIVAPAGVNNARWGNGDGTVTFGDRLLPSPIRYQLVEQDVLLFHPTIGVGVRPVEWLRLGVSFQWGVAIIRYLNHTNAGTGPENPAEDIRTEMNVVDPFVPGVIASVHAVPIDELDIVFAARISDGIGADGTLSLQTGTFGTGADDSLVPTTSVVDSSGLNAGQPWQFSFGIRYANRLRPRASDPSVTESRTRRIDDPMYNERFDIELNVVYEMASQVQDFVVSVPDGAAVNVQAGGNSPPLTVAVPGPLPIPHGWRDQLSVRLGGDYNVIPGMASVRAGAFFETSGLNPRYQLADFLPGMRVGLSLGFTIRVMRFDVSLAYAHVFQQDHLVSTDQANHRLIGATGVRGACMDDSTYDTDAPIPQRECYPNGYGDVMNAGTYRAGYNVLAVQVGYHFE